MSETFGTEPTSTPTTVDNVVINALLEGIFDVLDFDGKKSILLFANMEYLMAEKLPEGLSDRRELLKILNSMRMLLQFSPQILYEIGRKFTLYLDPFGTSLSDFIALLNKSLIEPKFSCEHQSANEIIVQMENPRTENSTRNTTPNPLGLNLLIDEWMVKFYQGIFSEAVRKSVGGKVKINLESQTNHMCSFKILSEYSCS